MLRERELTDSVLITILTEIAVLFLLEHLVIFLDRNQKFLLDNVLDGFPELFAFSCCFYCISIYAHY